ncbi:MAG: pentapeptide repeat-containing protein [Sphaerospermopsis sp.]|jgi:uncharacterized protein YjbI with pentapeptide repeats|uniref:Pentapeptide repeat-containing protein n=2 Tax=Sphaerospermopsis TaxID=752201 RepID=A0ABR9V9I0_9CYAN|nr:MULTISPECIES: pentapeptide repeat-containing protein [Sphaerospermopsis]MEB3151653.1 pentapeptide repeat-containing protein [Sphaerospermopsis sp.]BAZ78991.1 pentapeptide repeat-containing protein [Sphaerospermopsis kisseleviana NIES-73]MBC5795588.1 pentapeptide repeat-containing protein [Sphaerospermopsis sp. LEGE 00249]MBD2132655.1 pentapeptide repeat-containing protein [Sphaerospermopsis sp. FACHB-1094]MBD2144123.1 pentapeptide repeat-containing protein [Sphaerospermopsis sp. FACHB-1194]
MNALCQTGLTIEARTDLRGANLSKANLFKAEMSSTNIMGANLREAVMPDGTVQY